MLVEHVSEVLQRKFLKLVCTASFRRRSHRILLIEGPVVSILSRTKEAERAEDEHLGTHSVFDNPLSYKSPSSWQCLQVIFTIYTKEGKGLPHNSRDLSILT
jgi:hypothetical protein